MKQPLHLRRLLPLLAMTLLCACAPPSTDLEPRYAAWTRYEAEPGATSFSSLDQVNRDNVDQLQVAWRYETAGANDTNPIVVDSIMYVPGEENSILALHAGTGRKLWSHTSSVSGVVTRRSLVYWENEDRSDRRIIFTQGSFDLLAIDALTGETIDSFGENGRVNLQEGLDIDPDFVTRATSSSPGVIYNDLIILGSATGEGYLATPGHIRAFDVKTGEQVWIFHTLPKPGEFGYDTWPEGRSDNGGGANAWGGLSVDEERGIVYVPLGSANYDFYGIDRHGENLFANSLVALNASTGERIWHFQTVHHDLWDYDLTATPVLLTARHEGEMVDVVALATKTGLVFVFNRETGEPLWPVEERQVPPSDMPGEQAWPTQPFPTKPEPFVPTHFDVEKDINPHIVPEDRDSLVELVRSMRYQGIFTPPSTDMTLQVPGNRGGANWGSTAGDPRDGTFFVLSYNMPSVLHLLPIVSGRTGTGSSPYDRGQAVYQEHCLTCHGVNLEGQPASGIASLIGVTGRLDHDELDNVIRNGRNLMPSWSHLSERDVESVKFFLANPDLVLVSDRPVESDEVPRNEPVRYQSEWRHILDSKGVPVIKPPWFRITAYDLNEGTMKWQIPAGEVAHLAEQGITDTGGALFIRGGPAVTAGGLIFLSTDTRLRAYDIEDGSELWSADLPGSGQGIPAVYEVDGRQYVAVSATADSRRWGQQPQAEEPGTPAYVAFALPEEPMD